MKLEQSTRLVIPVSAVNNWLPIQNIDLFE